MNTLLKIIALFSAAGLPVAFCAESYGLNVPSALSTSHVFGVFFVALLALTMLADYTGAKVLSVRKTKPGTTTPASRSALALAA